MLVKWLKFLRKYGPISRNDNMYDETILKSARRAGVKPIEFDHPHHDHVLDCLNGAENEPITIILTGTAGDGKTYLCRQAWNELGGDEALWGGDNPYLVLDTGSRRVHFIRDLSAWAPQQGQDWDSDKAEVLQHLSRSFAESEGSDSFIIAANDGQLVESWRRLPESEEVVLARLVIEELLVEDKQEAEGYRLKLFNLSRTSSALIFDRALEALLNHQGWEDEGLGLEGEADLFGPKCPIRHNYELLQEPLVQRRIRALLELCDHNGLHLPIRQILILLSNSILGHQDVRDYLMRPQDVPNIIADGTISKASLFNNVFGGNLPENRRQNITIFDYLERFQVGYETSNRIDNILIFGEDDPNLKVYFDEFIGKDTFYGADERYHASKREYIEGTSENEDVTQEFLNTLVCQRRGLFFKIPADREKEMKLWNLTVFKFAGEYLEDVVEMIQNNKPVKRPILLRLVKGLNRVFTGMLINSDRELYLATSGNSSQVKVCRILVEHISVEPSKGEKVILRLDGQGKKVLLSVFLTPSTPVNFELSLIRYEFLSRISEEGALPASFSKECFEDLLAFKSQLIAAFNNRHEQDITDDMPSAGLKLLVLTEQGMPDPKFVEVIP